MATIQQSSLKAPSHPDIVSLRDALTDDDELSRALRTLCKPSADPSAAFLRTAEFIFEGGQSNASELLLLLCVSDTVLKVDRQWFRYSAPVWTAQEPLAIGRTLAQPLKTILGFARQAIDDDKRDVHRSIDALDKQLSKNSFLTSIVANLGSQEPIAKAMDPSNFFDQNRSLVAFKDAVFDLTSSSFRDAAPADLLSTRVNVSKSEAETLLNDNVWLDGTFEEQKRQLLAHLCPRLLE